MCRRIFIVKGHENEGPEFVYEYLHGSDVDAFYPRPVKISQAHLH